MIRTVRGKTRAFGGNEPSKAATETWGIIEPLDKPSGSATDVDRDVEIGDSSKDVITSGTHLI